MRPGESHIHATTIDSLPDDVLLNIFDFYRSDQDLYGCHFHPILHRLAHICSRWRRIIYSSPRRLNLQLLCTHGTPVRKNLGYWPLLPLIIDYFTIRDADDRKCSTPSDSDEDNVVAALDNSTRVRYLGISVTSSLLEKMGTAMRKPFPTLTHLCLSTDENVPALPDGFLGVSSPSLRVVHLNGIHFPALPTLLLSTLSLVDLRLLDIPHYISPEAMVANLAALTMLRTLFIGFRKPTLLSRTRRQDPITRTGLPFLKVFRFHGVKEYLEDLIAQIDTPQLSHFRILYFNRLDFRVPRLSEFFGRTPNLSRFKRARIHFDVNYVYVRLYREREELLDFSFQISCKGLDWQVSHVAQILSQSGAMIFDIGDLSIDVRNLPPGWKDHMDVTELEWLELFHLFTAVKTLRMKTLTVSGKSTVQFAHGLKGITQMVTGMLCRLHSLSLEDEPLQSSESSRFCV